MRGPRVLPRKGLLGSIVASGLGCLLAVVLAGSAYATGYTVAGVTSFNNGSGVTGSILPVASPGTVDTCLTGDCNLSSNDYLVFQVAVTSGTLLNVSSSILAYPTLRSAAGVGDGGAGTSAASGSLSVPSAPAWSFTGLTGTSNLLYATFPTGSFENTGGGPFPSGTLSFKLTPSGATFFSFQEQFTVVPEPSTGALLLLGAPLLAFFRRRNRG